MRKKRVWLAILVLGALLLFAAGCGQKQAEKFTVATGSTLIADIVRAVGGEKVDVSNIVPPGTCPGHFDLKPDDVRKLASAKLLLYHDWQGNTFNKSVLASAGNKELVAVPVAVAGNWMAPPVQKEAIKRIAQILGEKDAANKAYYEENAERLMATVTDEERKLKERLQSAKVAGRKVICAEMQAGFLKWAGFDVVATYGRPEDLTPKKLQELIEKGKAQGVGLIVDNLQSGPDAGKGLAEELGAARVTLSNFPGGFAGTETWKAAVEKNVDLLLSALKGK
ncbi:MAG: metal ABC transporter substrate-binding protein [Thermacetogeniaceae bacterium]